MTLDTQVYLLRERGRQEEPRTRPPLRSGPLLTHILLTSPTTRRSRFAFACRRKILYECDAKIEASH